jgi:hypothetical protein
MNILDWVWRLISTHQTYSALIAAWIGSNFVSALPSPDAASGQFYKFFFSLMHGLAGSLPRLLPSLRLPSDPSRNSPPFFGNGKTVPPPPPNPPGIIP